MATHNERTEDTPRTPPPPSSGDNYYPSSPTPRVSEGRTIHSAPRSSVSHISHISLVTKAQLAEIAPDGGRCVITHLEALVDRCHVLRQSVGKDHKLMQRLEHVWGVPKHMLSVNGPDNLIFLRPDYHRSFDAGNWALVPYSEELLAKISDYAINNQFIGNPPYYLEKFPDEVREYQFCHFGGPPEVIFRHHQSDPKFFRVFHEPYTEIVIKSHIHPFFAIYNVAQKYGEYIKTNETSQLNKELDSRVRTCLNIFNAWKNTSLPGESPQTPSELHSRTTPFGTSAPPSDHSRTTRSRKSAPPSDQASQSSGSVKRRRTQHGGDTAYKRRRLTQSLASSSLLTPCTSQARHDAVDLAKLSIPDSAHSLTSIRSWAKEVTHGKLDPRFMVPRRIDARLALESYSREKPGEVSV